ncbi:glycosyltransferase family 4 protein [Aeromicrobium sp. SORGH_AS_0981]|uniref:glycosyltransferase family 4 protein n=1 Tax=Aeromicrobium sp. SORGH_AS_0981 TaxID=3041802 RepID=UPI0037C18A06
MIFVGTFEHRKGIIQLLEAWPEVKRLQPTARLTVLGRGSLEAEVRTQCRDLRDVDLQVAPPRELIWRSLASHHVLCLFSQPSLQWKEQVGLPIVEALSLGLEVVASDETGLAEWLESHGHIVVPWSSTAMELARAISDAIGSPRTRASIQAALPETDGRLEADRWLHSDPARDVGGQSA